VTPAPLVSIIIPTYEQSDLAYQAALSGLAQDYPSLEVIVVDDASPTARYDAVRAIDDPRLRYVRRAENIGRTENYRRSLRDLASGEWAVMLDGDDYFTDKRFVSAAIEAAAASAEIVIVAARAEMHTPSRTIVSEHPGDMLIDGVDLLRSLPDKRYFLHHLAVLYRRTDALALDFYRSPTLSSDWESLYRLASHGKVRFIDRVVGVWRIHGSNASSSSAIDEMIDNLDVWDAIYAEAAARGMPATIACRRSEAMQRYLMRHHIPRAARSWRGLRTYIAQLRRRRPAALLGLIDAKTLVRLALALNGYYGAP
jgi:glycosyltransferase involved in cell wall biosynthesis